MIHNNIQKTDFVPKLPHCAQSPDLDGVIEVVSMISKKTDTEIRNMITSGKVTLTAKIIKDIFQDIPYFMIFLFLLYINLPLLMLRLILYTMMIL